MRAYATCATYSEFILNNGGPINPIHPNGVGWKLTCCLPTKVYNSERDMYMNGVIWYWQREKLDERE